MAGPLQTWHHPTAEEIDAFNSRINALEQNGWKVPAYSDEDDELTITRGTQTRTIYRTGAARHRAARTERCEETVVKDGQPQGCGRPLDERGYCDRPSEHQEN